MFRFQLLCLFFLTPYTSNPEFCCSEFGISLFHHSIAPAYRNIYENVIQDYLTYIELAPAEAEAYIMVGIGYQKKDLYEPALYYFTQVMEMELKQVKAYANRAETYRLMVR